MRRLEILIRFSCAFMGEKNVVGLKADYSKLLDVCSIVH